MFGLGQQGYGGGYGGQGQQGYQPGYQQGYGNQPSFLSNPNQPVKIISSINPSFCLDSSQDKSELNDLIIYHQNNGPNQKWRVLNDGMGNIGFASLQNGGTLQVPIQSNGKEGTKCIVGPPIGNPNEKWQVVPEGNFFVIRSAINPNLCLDIDG